MQSQTASPHRNIFIYLNVLSRDVARAGSLCDSASLRSKQLPMPASRNYARDTLRISPIATIAGNASRARTLASYSPSKCATELA